MEVSKINLDLLGQRIQKIVDEGAENIRQKHIAAGQVASGRTLNSIQPEVQVGANSVRAIIWGRKGYRSLEEGTPPGDYPAGLFRIILDWMHFKGIHGTPIPYKRKESAGWRPKYTPEDRGDRTLAYFIARKIRKEGTWLYRHQESRPDIYTREVENVAVRIEESLIKIFAMEADNINKN